MPGTQKPKILLLLLIVPVLFSCGVNRPALHVRVQDDLTKRPLRGAECLLPKAQAKSDAAGYCRFADWSPQDLLRVSAPGYLSAEAGLPTPPDGARAVTLTVSLSPAQATGAILDAYTGRPVAGAEVQAGGRAFLTDPSGHFTIFAPTFPLTLTARAAGYEAGQGTFLTTTFSLSLRPNTLEGTVLDAYDGRPLAGARITLTGSLLLTTTSGPDGRYFLEGIPERFTLQVRTARYRPAALSLERTTQYDLRLRPAFLRGLVRDESGNPIPQARVVCAGRYTHTDAQGRFLLEDVPEVAVVQVLSPGFAKQVITATDTPSITVTLTPFVVHGIYVTSYVISTYDGDPDTEDWFTSLLDLVEGTELNAMVLEVKDAWGAVVYNTQISQVLELGTADPRYDVSEILRECHRRGIYTIAYIVTFEDSRLAEAHPEWAVQSASRGGPWKDRRGLKWMDPYRTEVWEYNLAIARELAGLGFDEIQFDYIRFPTDGNISDIVYAEETDIEKQYATIAGFVQRAYEELAPLGVFISADIFGYAAWRKMWEQGQDISRMTYYLDYLCPMSYPSHYSPGEQGCANPNACPYIIVLETMKRAYAQMTEGQRAKVRPWLQDFDLGEPPYGPNEVQEQIRAAQDGGAVGWCLWNAGNVYTEGVDYSP
ncbi:MAG: putative glycoside hydrolase [Chloroflexia bacterium]